jgi:Transmembrane domain of unknown function (DUF3566)
MVAGYAAKRRRRRTLLARNEDRTVATIDNATEKVRARRRPNAPEPTLEESVQAAETPTFAVASPMAPRASRSASRKRRTRVEIHNVAPLSVLKFSLIFYFCAMLVFWVALLVIYVFLSAAGAIDSLAKILGYLFSNAPSSTRGPTPMKINSTLVFTYLFMALCVFTVVWSFINMAVAYIYNLISDVIGGVQVTLSDRNA